MALKDFFETDCLFSEEMSAGEDREVWLKLACRFPKVGYIGHALSIYYINQTGSICALAFQSRESPFEGPLLCA